MDQSNTVKKAGVPQARELTPAEDFVWDRLVAGSPQGNVFLRSDWLRLLVETSHNDLRLMRIGVFNAREELRGGWAFLYHERAGVRITEVFDLFYCGPMLAGDLCGNLSTRGESQRVLAELIQGASARMDQLLAETHPNFRDMRPFLYQGWTVVPEYTHIWDFSNPDALLRVMNREKWREIRRAREQYKIGVEPITEENFRDFMVLYREAMGKFSWYPPPHWEEMQLRRVRWMEEQDGCRLYTVRDDQGELLAGVLALISREDETAYYWRMGYGAAGRKAIVVPALYWECAQDLCTGENPIRYINFGSSPQPALSQFKDYLGAEATEHYRLILRKPSMRLQLMDWREQGRDRARRLVGASAGLRSVYQMLQRLPFLSMAVGGIGEVLPALF